MDEDIKRYAHLIDEEYPGSTTRPRMSMEERAAQFSPFAALTGFAAEIEEARKEAIDAVENEIERTAFVEDA